MDNTNLLDMIAVIEQERSFNEAAALLCTQPGQKRLYETKARQAGSTISAIRHEMARSQAGKQRKRTKARQLDAYIDLLIETEVDTGRSARSILEMRPEWLV